MVVKFDRAKYRELAEQGHPLEAVYRMQTAGSSKECNLEDCALGGKIMPLQRYARVYYQDEDVVEMFHVACFMREFVEHGRH